jgi:acetylornithine deacetylase/succinyl-diaminopimelate desuccinylase-like protein
VGLKVVIEGEEETGRPTFMDWVRSDPGRFACDVALVADSGNWKVGEPTLTTSLRGLAEVHVEVSTLQAPGHSGLFGGPVPDALMALARILSTLHDDRGDVAVAGLASGTWDGRQVDADELRATARMLEGVRFQGSGTLADHLFARPSITAIGLDAPSVATASNALIPTARAKLSARVPPGQDPRDAAEAIAAHVRAATPHGADVQTRIGGTAFGWRLPPGGRGEEAALRALEGAYGKAPVKVGSGGAIPLVDTLAGATGADIVLWGAADDGAQIHAADESVDLGDLERAARAQVLLVEELGKR